MKSYVVLRSLCLWVTVAGIVSSTLLSSCTSCSTGSSASEDEDTVATNDIAVASDLPFDTLVSFCNWTEIALKDAPSSTGKWVASMFLGEQFTVTGDTASEVSNGKRVRYHKVRLKDNKEGWVQDDFIAIDAARGVFSKEVTIYLRPDLATASNKKFKALDVVAVRPAGDGWVEVVGKTAGGTWFQKGYVREGDLAYSTADVNLAVLYRRAIETKDEDLKAKKLEELMAAGFDNASLFSIVFPEIEKAAGEIIEYNFDNTTAEVANYDTLENHAVSFKTDRFDNASGAASFNGESSYLGGIVKDDNVNISYFAWVYLEKADHAMVPFFSGNSCTSGYGLSLEPKGGGLVPTILCAGMPSNPTQSTQVVQVGEWAHVGFVKAGNNFSIYINGELSSSGDSKYNALTGELTIGATPGCNGAAYTSFFNGMMDGLYIVRKALTAEEVQVVMDVMD